MLRGPVWWQQPSFWWVLGWRAENHKSRGEEYLCEIVSSLLSALPLPVELPGFKNVHFVLMNFCNHACLPMLPPSNTLAGRFSLVMPHTGDYMLTQEGLSGTQITAMGVFSWLSREDWGMRNSCCPCSKTTFVSTLSLKMTRATQYLCKTMAPAPDIETFWMSAWIYMPSLWFPLLTSPLTHCLRYWSVCAGCASLALSPALEPCLPHAQLRKPNLSTHAFYRGWNTTVWFPACQPFFR